jgi:hypothetical protein
LAVPARLVIIGNAISITRAAIKPEKNFIGLLGLFILTPYLWNPHAALKNI